MKKLLIAAGLLLASTFAFANIELDINMYGTLAKVMATESFDEDSDGKRLKTDIKQPFAFGFEDNVTFYFGHRESKFDAGLSLLLNVDFFNKLEFKSNSMTTSFSGTGVNVGLGVGPAFRITFANPFSLFIRPTLGFNLMVYESEEIGSGKYAHKQTIAEFDLFRFDLNVGGRSWLLNVDGFHLGIDYGAILGFGAGFGSAGVKFSNSSISSTNTGFGAGSVDFKLYLGCCMNFGDRGYDRM